MAALRKGQWVKTTRDLTLGPDVEPAGTVGILYKRVTADDGIEVCEVHLVDVPQGTTRKRCAILEADLVRAEREDVPADRLATYDPDWQPAPNE